MQSVYEAAGGAAGLRRLAEAWHARVMADEMVSHAFSHGFHPQHTERLAAYWAEALGGPSAYSGTYGDETSVVRIHSGSTASGTSRTSASPSICAHGPPKSSDRTTTLTRASLRALRVFAREG
jgi:hypothetical protein